MKFSGERGVETSLKPNYSKPYANSLDFKAFGKTRSNVNMKLTGDMLGLIDIKNIDGNKITIGWNDSSQNPKAYNHSIGQTVPPRPFFGVNKTELSDIKKEFKSEISTALREVGSEESRAFEARLDSLLSLFKTGSDDEG